MSNLPRDVTVTFKVPIVDPVRIEEALRRLGAEEVQVEASPAVAAPETTGKVSRQRETEMLAAIRAAGVARWADLQSATQARNTLERLLAQRRIERVRHGLYKVSGTDVDDAGIVKGIARERAGRGRSGMVLDLLETPRSAPEIRDALGVSRQRVDQILKRMLAAGAIRRTRMETERSEWLYVREGKSLRDAIVRRQPELTRTDAEILNLLPPGEGVRNVAITERIGRPTGTTMARLVAKGLVERLGSTNRAIIRLTRKGLEHPGYDPNAEHLPGTSESEMFNSEQLQLLVALDALGTAKARDLTFASRIPTTPRMGTGQHMQRLREAGYVEQIACRNAGLRYSATRKAAPLIADARLRGLAITPEEARTRVEEGYRALSERLSISKQGRKIAADGRGADILRMLAAADTLTVSEIQKAMHNPYANIASLSVALRFYEAKGFLARRGSIDEGKAHHWAITEAGREMVRDRFGSA